MYKSFPDFSLNYKTKRMVSTPTGSRAPICSRCWHSRGHLQTTTKSGDGTPVGIPALDQQLDKLKAQLADLLSHYTDRHPDVRKVKDEIARVEKMRDQALADLKASAATTSASGNPPAAGPDNLDSRDAAATIQLQGQLKANQIDTANKEHEIAALKAKINDYQSTFKRGTRTRTAIRGPYARLRPVQGKL